MKKTVALLAVLVVLFGTAMPSHAHGGWWWPGALVGGLVLGAAVAASHPHTYYYPAPYYSPYPYYAYPAPPVAYAAPPAPAIQREVVYSHGRYVLYGDGVTQPWQWVWVLNPPPSPAASTSAIPAPPQEPWYYCPSAQAYYPDVQTCPEAWIKVAPRPR